MTDGSAVTRQVRRAFNLAKRVGGRVVSSRDSETNGAPIPEVVPIAALVTPFDPEYYRERYPDLVELDQDQLIEHWNTSGQLENRQGWPEGDKLISAIQDSNKFDRARETVLLVLHEGSYTGAPILGWNIARELSKTKNVITLLMKGGDLTPAFEQVSTVVINGDGIDWNKFESKIVAEGIAEKFNPTYAIANSAMTYPFTPHLGRAGVPVVTLVHEFAAGLRTPKGTLLDDYYQQVDQVIFPAEIVAATMREDYPVLAERDVLILPQGQSEIPPKPQTALAKSESVAPIKKPIGQVVDDYLSGLSDNDVLVLGAGTIEPRKGVDLFIQSAAYLQRRYYPQHIKFAWIGGDGHDHLYVSQVREQLRRAGAPAPIDFLFPTDDLTPLYNRTDILFLSSRLDPMPNVAIDASVKGIPVVAFDKASGYAELLSQDLSLRELVVPDSDITAAAELIARLADDNETRSMLGKKVQSQANSVFDMSTYVARLDQLGHRPKHRTTP